MSMAFPWVRILTAWLTCQFTRLFTQCNVSLADLEESLGLENTNHEWLIVFLTGRMDMMSRELCWQVFRCLFHDLSSFLSLFLYSLFSETSWVRVWDKSGELQTQPALSPFIPPDLVNIFFFFFSFIFISWRLITSQHFSGFCHTLTWISHGFTCIPHPDPPSHLPLHPIPLGLPSVPGPSTCLMHPTWAGDLFHYR